MPHHKRDPVYLQGSRLPVDPVYCANCGSLEGYATVYTPHVFFVCDGCIYSSGKPPGASEMTKKQMAERGLRVVPV